MKHFLCLLLCFAIPVYGQDRTQPIANMKAWCDCVMQGGVCQVTNGPAPKPGSRIFTTAGPINADVYNAIKQEGGLMCVKGSDACTASWDGDTCKAFRLMFRQEPMVCLRPGEPASR